MIRSRNIALLLLAAGLGGVCALLPAMAQPHKFDGFAEHFDLGRSSVSGAVCSADRTFDDSLSPGARTWSITCRGWPGQTLGKIYVFDRGNGDDNAGKWRAALGTRADCRPAGSDRLACETKGATKLHYVAMGARNHGAFYAVEGMAGIGDILTTAYSYVRGDIAAPKAIDERAESVSGVTSTDIGALVQSEGPGDPASQNHRNEAYRRNAAWQFSDAEAIFSSLSANAGDKDAASADQVEALYNVALNVSNQGRFTEAAAYFQQADALAEKSGLTARMAGVALNYRALDARNRQDYPAAIAFAEKAIATRATPEYGVSVIRDGDDAIRIVDGGAQTALGRLSDDGRNALRDAQAWLIEATALRASGQADRARAVLSDHVAPIINRPLAGSGGNAVVLGDALPWLQMQARTTLLDLSIGTPAANDATGAFRSYADRFVARNPASLPAGAILLNLARAESAAGMQDRALADFEHAFSIYREQRGALGASADLSAPYFEMLLHQAEASPGTSHDLEERFFAAAQTLVSQSSAEAAKRQAARVMSSNGAAAGLARALDETERAIAAKSGEIGVAQRSRSAKASEIAGLQAELQDLTQQRAALAQKLFEANPGYAAQLKNLVTIGEVQAALRPGELYVKTFLLGDGGYGIRIGKDGVKLYRIALTRESGAKLVNDLRESIDFPVMSQDGQVELNPFNVAKAHDAFTTILGPIAGDFAGGGKHLIFEPDATLIALPLNALVVDQASVDAMARNTERAKTSPLPLSYDGVAWLGRQDATSIALSPAAFLQTRKARQLAKDRGAQDDRLPLRAFGDPVISQDPRAYSSVRAHFATTADDANFCGLVRHSLAALHPLPQTAEEVSGIAKTLGLGPDAYATGAAFNDADIVAQGGEGGLAHYRIVYFATHGILPKEVHGCVEPALVTSLGAQGGDGLLTQTEIRGLKLDADLVVLSACDTGRNGEGGNESLGGLVLAFEEAGARNVLVSNWKVDSAATTQLMNAMFRAGIGDQASALAAGERALMDNADFSHPYFWAAFMVVGDGASAAPNLAAAK